MRTTRHQFLWSLSFSLLTTFSHAISEREILAATSSAYNSLLAGDTFSFSRPIRRVAVIGAGPSGLQAAAALLENGFEVRLFERKPSPGGNWYYSEDLPIPANFPNTPLEFNAYTPDTPSKLPLSKVFEDGEEGITNNWRLREHWNPSPVWSSLTSNSPPSLTALPGVDYPTDTEWLIPQRKIEKTVRRYASLHGINSNDEEYANTTSYSTRVERIHKPANGTLWALFLKRVVEIPHSRDPVTKNFQVRVDWWTEEFDAVVVSTNGADSAYTPPVPGLSEWAHAYPDQIYHSRSYRHAERLRGKNVLIVGASVSASEIARDIKTVVGNFSISLRHHDTFPSIFRRRSFLRLPANVTHIAEIKSFSKVPGDAPRQSGVRDAILHLVDGTEITGYDEIIFATGFLRSNPFLVGFHNTTIIGNDEPDVEVAPLITDGGQVRSLHWTGHYIEDPTLVFTSMGRPWTVGRFQSAAIAKIWTGKADLPSKERMWETYPGAGKDLYQVNTFGAIGEEAIWRLWITWVNNMNIKYGGRLVAPWNVKHREEFVYFADSAWEKGFIHFQNFTELDNVPRSQWPSRNDSRSDFTGSDFASSQLVKSEFEIESADMADEHGDVKVWGDFAVGQW